MSEEKKPMQVFKFTLSTGKVIYLREADIEDTEVSTKIAGALAGPENTAYLSVLFQKEMLKRVLVKVNDKVLTATEKETIKSMFSLKEYSQATLALKQVTGDDNEGKLDLTPEITTL